jgi:hypothetical protein
VRGFCILGAAILTVSNTTSVVQYNGNGATVNWPTGFRFFKNTDLVVTKRSVAGVTTVLTLNTDYSVSGANSLQGGFVTTTNALAVGELLTIARVLTVQQLTDLRNQGEYFAEIHEDVFDYLTMLIQQTGESDSRALRHPRDSEHYQAEARRIVDLEDPVDAQDAATKNWVGKFVDSVSGLINNTLGIAYDGGNLFDYLRFGVARTVDSIDALKALSGSRNQRAFALGFYGKGDGGGGEYFAVPGDTTSTEIAGFLVVGNDGTRWQLVYTNGVSIKQLGARGTWNGTTGADDTAAIQRAANLGVRRITVPSLPAGFSYQTTAPILVTLSFAIFGDSVETQQSIGTFQNVRGAGSWFHFNHPGRGFDIQRGTAGFQGVELRDIGMLRSHTVTAGTFVPTVYDYDVYVSDCADFKMFNVCMLNPYRGLFVTNGQQGRVWIDKLYGQPIMNGIVLKLTYDCPRLLNVNWWPYWSFHSTVWAYHKLNTVGLTTWRADGLFIENYFSIFHRFGWQVSGDVTNGTTFKAKVSGMFLDNCAYGYFVDSTARGHTASIVNLSIQMDPAVVDTGAKPVFVVPDSCDIDIINLSTSISIAEAVRVSGPFCRVGLHNPKVYDWAKGVAAAAIINDSTDSSIVVTGRKIFDLGGSNPIYSGSGKIIADVASGSFSGTTNASGDVVITHNGRATTNMQRLQVKSVASLNPVCTASGINTITVRVFNSATGAGLASTAVLLDWQVGMG